MNRVQGKVALITGGARGTGASHARVLIDEGAHVIGDDRRVPTGCWTKTLDINLTESLRGLTESVALEVGHTGVPHS